MISTLITVRQGQMILDAILTFGSAALVYTQRPALRLRSDELSAMMQRIRDARGLLVRQYDRMSKANFEHVCGRQLGISFEADELDDVIVALATILREGEQNPANMRILVAEMEEIVALIALLRGCRASVEMMMAG
jgi:hypothetical protein